MQADAMPLDTLLAALLETGLNRILALDPTSNARRQSLNGKVLRLELRQLKPLWLLFSRQQVDILSRYTGQPDASLSLSLSGLDLLRKPERLSQYIREERLDLQGDPALFHAFSNLLGQLEIDWEEQLSRYLGDVLAHSLCQGLRQLQQQADRQLQLTRRDLADYLTEELRLAPGPLEVAHFCDEVDAVAQRLEQTALRIERLSQRRPA